jgi:hypothetical protein
MLDDLFLWDQALNAERLASKAELAQAFTSDRTDDGGVCLLRAFLLGEETLLARFHFIVLPLPP